MGEFDILDDVFDFFDEPVADDAEVCELLPPSRDEQEVHDDDIIPPPTQEDIEREENAHRTYVEERRNRNTVRKTASVSRK